MKIVGGTWSNWSGGVRCKPRQVTAPKNVVELAAAIRGAEGSVRVPGSGHSFTPLCATDGTLLDMAAFYGLKSTDKENGIATLAAATPLWAAGPSLHAQELAFKNMGDIDGRTLGSFSAEVAGFQLVLANGEVLNCSPRENFEVFAAGRTSLGMFGVMTEISQRVRPVYRLVEDNFLLAPEELFRRLDELVANNRHFEFFWFPYANVAICKTLNETEKPAPTPRNAEELRVRGEAGGADSRIFSGINEVLPYAPFLLKPAHRLFSQFMPGAARVRWSHEIFPSPRPTRFNEMEYAVPFAQGADCVREIVQTIRRKRINTGFPLEFRSVAADNVWLSPFYERESATIAVHQYRRIDTAPLFDACETIFRLYNGRPHWGKRHTRSLAELQTLYPKFDQFRALRRKLDPGGKFLNAYLKMMFE
jgi:FAD-linked oxidoreductase